MRFKSHIFKTQVAQDQNPNSRTLNIAHLLQPHVGIRNSSGSRLRVGAQLRTTHLLQLHVGIRNSFIRELDPEEGHLLRFSLWNQLALAGRKPPDLGFMVQGLGLGVKGLGFEV